LDIEHEITSFPLGDFVWAIKFDLKEGLKAENDSSDTYYVLDYIAERKAANDLIASILDGRYKDQKQRLSHSGFPEVFYIIEGSPTHCSAVSPKQMDTAIVSTQVTSGFKVIRTKELSETLAYLGTLTNSIKKKWNAIMADESVEELAVRCSFQEFRMEENMNSKSVGSVWAKMLMNIKGMGLTSVNSVIGEYSTFKSFYDSMNSYYNKLGALSQFKINQSIQEKIAVTFSLEEYPDLEPVAL
jgi:crossover junction endonuclease MUS81